MSEQRQNSENVSKMISNLTVLLDNYSDEIPNRIVSSIPKEDQKFKVRKGWWQSLELNLHMVQTIGILTPDLNDRIELFQIKYLLDKNPETSFSGRLTTREDIDEANKLIRDILSYLLGDRSLES